jgi:uncharacterized membrane protein YphA (DoxX/SURF4 family)
MSLSFPKAGESEASRRALEIGSAIVRWGLGVYFVYMGVRKAMDPVGFLKQLHQYQMPLSPLLLNSIAGALPWFEVFCGLLLVVGIAVRGAALLWVAMLIPFSIVVLNRAMHLSVTKAIAFCAVKFNCGCGGGEVVICHKLLENTLLTVLSLWLVYSPRRAFSLRHTLFRSGGNKESPSVEIKPAVQTADR